MDLKEYVDRMKNLRPGNELAINGIPFAVTDERTHIHSDRSDELLWTRMSIRRVRRRVATRQSQTWLEVPGLLNDAYTVHVSRYLGVYKGSAVRQASAPIAWQGRTHLAAYGREISFVGARSVMAGEFIVYSPLHGESRRLRLEKMVDETAWQVHEVTPIGRDKVSFAR